MIGRDEGSIRDMRLRRLILLSLYPAYRRDRRPPRQGRAWKRRPRRSDRGSPRSARHRRARVRPRLLGDRDYARERLGIAASTAQKMARLSRQLRDLPLLRAAVCAGEVSTRAAEAVVPVAKGEHEAAWVARARHDTVRGLKAA